MRKARSHCSLRERVRGLSSPSRSASKAPNSRIVSPVCELLSIVSQAPFQACGDVFLNVRQNFAIFMRFGPGLGPTPMRYCLRTTTNMVLKGDTTWHIREVTVLTAHR